MLYQNDYFDLFVRQNQVIMHTKKTGFPLKSFDTILKQCPRIKINSFVELNKAINQENTDHQIGIYLPPIEIEVASDRMSAQLIMNCNQEEWQSEEQQLPKLIQHALEKAGVTYGVIDVEQLECVPNKPVIIANGTPAIQGDNAKITYLTMPERKPVIREDGSADYFEMNFVTPIAADDWLGEKIPPLPGKEGMDVLGNAIPAQYGKDEPMFYDAQSVYESEEDGKIVLRAKFSGALEVKNGLVGVSNQLIVKGDVGPETGSITFDGDVVIRGTVLAGYSVNAIGDIAIEDFEGVTNAKEIRSSEGDIFIRGGVFGGGTTIIDAANSIYIKHANNCKLYSKELHAGLYVLGCEIIAERVFVDRYKGKIIGGTVEALYSIETAYAGNQHERATVLTAKGIQKDEIHRDIQQMAKDLKERQEMAKRLSAHLQVTEGKKHELSDQQIEALSKLERSYEQNQQAIFELDRQIQKSLQMIKTAVRPKIKIMKKAYPGVTLQIEQKSTILQKETTGTFELIDGVLNV